MPAPKTIAALGTAAFLVVASGAARAADLPARVAPTPYAAPLPVFTWTGAYFGVNAGAAFDVESRITNAGLTTGNNGIASGARPGTAKLNESGVAVGGQIGYNYEFVGLGGFGGAGSGVVIGVEADADYTDLGRSRTIAGANATDTTFRSGMDYLGTVRGRLGYAFNQVLVYGTGGFAYGDVFQRGVFFAPGSTAARFVGSRDKTQTGYAAGGGVEYALPTGSFLNVFHSSAVTVKVEYLYYDLGGGTVVALPAAGSTGTGGYASRFKTDGNLVRVGLNYKF